MGEADGNVVLSKFFFFSFRLKNNLIEIDGTSKKFYIFKLRTRERRRIFVQSYYMFCLISKNLILH